MASDRIPAATREQVREDLQNIKREWGLLRRAASKKIVQATPHINRGLNFAHRSFQGEIRNLQQVARTVRASQSGALPAPEARFQRWSMPLPPRQPDPFEAIDRHPPAFNPFEHHDIPVDYESDDPDVMLRLLETRKGRRAATATTSSLFGF